MPTRSEQGLVCAGRPRDLPDQPGGGNRGVRQGRLATTDIRVEDVVAVDEHDLTAFGAVQGVAEPVSSGSNSGGDFAASDDERVVDEDAFVVFGVEDLVGEHHQRLVVDLGDVEDCRSWSSPRDDQAATLLRLS